MPVIDTASSFVADCSAALATSPSRTFSLKCKRIFFLGSNVTVSLAVVRMTLETHTLEISMFRRRGAASVVVYHYVSSERDVATLVQKANEEFDQHRQCSECEWLFTKHPSGRCTECNKFRYFTSTSDGDPALCAICLEPLRGCLTQYPCCRHLAHSRCLANRPRVCPQRCGGDVVPTLTESGTDTDDDED